MAKSVTASNAEMREDVNLDEYVGMILQMASIRFGFGRRTGIWCGPG